MCHTARARGGARAVMAPAGAGALLGAGGRAGEGTGGSGRGGDGGSGGGGTGGAAGGAHSASGGRADVERLGTLAARDARALCGGATPLRIAPRALQATQAALRELQAAREACERAPVEYLRQYGPDAPFFKQLEGTARVLGGVRALELVAEPETRPFPRAPSSYAPFASLRHLRLERCAVARGAGAEAIAALRDALEALELERCTALLAADDGATDASEARGEGVGALGEALLCGADEASLDDAPAWPRLSSLRARKCGLERLSAACLRAAAGGGALTRLDLSWNSLERLDALGCVRTLVMVDVSFNRLASLRGLEASAASLEVLAARGNALARVASALPLPHLAALDLAGNVLADVSDVARLASLSSLRALCLEENPVAWASGYRLGVLAAFAGALVTLDGDAPTVTEAAATVRATPARGLPGARAQGNADVDAAAAARAQQHLSPRALPERLETAWRRGSLDGGSSDDSGDSSARTGDGAGGIERRAGGGRRRRPRIRTIAEAEESARGGATWVAHAATPSGATAGGGGGSRSSGVSETASPLRQPPLLGALAAGEAEADALRERAEEFKRQSGSQWLTSFNEWLDRRVPVLREREHGAGADSPSSPCTPRTPPDAVLEADLEQLLSSVRSARAARATTPHVLPRSGSPPRYEDAVLHPRPASSSTGAVDGACALPAQAKAATPTMRELVARKRGGVSGDGSDGSGSDCGGVWYVQSPLARGGSALGDARWRRAQSDTSDTTSDSQLDSGSDSRSPLEDTDSEDEALGIGSAGGAGYRVCGMNGLRGVATGPSIVEDHIRYYRAGSKSVAAAASSPPPTARLRGSGVQLTPERVEREIGASQRENADALARRAAVLAPPQRGDC